MFLDFRIHTNYDQHIRPYLKNGIIIDTCVLKEIIDGIVLSRITKKESQELKNIDFFLQLIKIHKKWDKFFITPHILTEVCQKIRSEYCTWENQEQIIGEIMPIIKNMGEFQIKKGNFLDIIENNKNVRIEAGDISIFVKTDDFLAKKEKIAILSNDSGVNDKYMGDDRVMVMDYNSVINNL